LATSGAAGTLQNSKGFRAVSGTNGAEMHLPDGDVAEVAPRLSQAAISRFVDKPEFCDERKKENDLFYPPGL